MNNLPSFLSKKIKSWPFWIFVAGAALLIFYFVQLVRYPIAVDFQKSSAAPSLGGQPNIVVILTDDQAGADINVMTSVKEMLAQNGNVFSNFLISYPLCCPSRATFLTGQYAHNSGVKGNSPPEGGYSALDHTNTLPVWLQNVGYYTAHIGKYLNGYGSEEGVPPETIPPGWSEWYGAVDPTTYQMYNYTLNENGILKTYGAAEADYQSDVFTQKAVSFIQKLENDPRPFFLTVAYVAPHMEGPSDDYPISEVLTNNPRAAPRHEGLFENLELPQPPSFNEINVSDKPSFIQAIPLMGKGGISFTTNIYRNRLEALLAIDEGVAEIMETLSITGKLDNTVVVFMSDNGYFYGEHRLPAGKMFVYEESIKVPLIIYSPALPSGQTIPKIAANIDIAPTIVELAGAQAQRTMDGRSLMSLINDPNVQWRGDLLIENFDLDYSAVRNEKYIYVEYGSNPKKEYEFYNFVADSCHQADPYQLESQHRNKCYGPVKKDLQQRLEVLKVCAGASCW